jgi:hypothetical protein
MIIVFCVIYTSSFEAVLSHAGKRLHASRTEQVLEINPVRRAIVILIRYPVPRAAVAAEVQVFALPAFFGKLFGRREETPRRVALRHAGKRIRPDIAQPVFIENEEIAGVNGAVPFHHELQRTMPAHIAGLRLAPACDGREVVDVPYADVFAPLIIRVPQIEQALEEGRIAFRTQMIGERAARKLQRLQAGDELQVKKAVLFEEIICFSMPRAFFPLPPRVC